MHAWLIATICFAAPTLSTTIGYAAPGEGQHRPDHYESFEQIAPNELLRGLYSQALTTFQEYFEIDGTLPRDGSSRHQAGEFRLKLFPQGKSRSREHLSAEGSFRLSPENDRQELTLRFKSSKHPQGSLLPPNDDAI